MSAEFFVGMLIGVGFGILIGLACTLTYAMKQFRLLDAKRSTGAELGRPSTWRTEKTIQSIRKGGSDSGGSMGNEDIPGQAERDQAARDASVVPFDPEQQAPI